MKLEEAISEAKDLMKGGRLWATEKEAIRYLITLAEQYQKIRELWGGFIEAIKLRLLKNLPTVEEIIIILRETIIKKYGGHIDIGSDVFDLAKAIHQELVRRIGGEDEKREVG